MAECWVCFLGMMAADQGSLAQARQPFAMMHSPVGAGEAWGGGAEGVFGWGDGREV